jgi:succinyl-CoA synthetase beta subunit
MNIHEYQARQLLVRYGVTLPEGDVCDTPEGAKAIAEKLFAGGAKIVVVKSQIQAGGRGKGTFKNGYKGGVKVLKSVSEVYDAAKNILGNVLVTKQTGPEGRLVTKLLVAVAPDIQKELYLAVLLDRATSRPLIMASTEGGMDIEEVAARTPEKIVKEWIDPAVGLQSYQGRKIAAALGLKGDVFNAAVKLLAGVYRTWWECDASLVEINPLCVIKTNDGKLDILTVDAKI